MHEFCNLFFFQYPQFKMSLIKCIFFKYSSKRYLQDILDVELGPELVLGVFVTICDVRLLVKPISDVFGTPIQLNIIKLKIMP